MKQKEKEEKKEEEEKEEKKEEEEEEKKKKKNCGIGFACTCKATNISGIFWTGYTRIHFRTQDSIR
jgi:hypothetical protein